MQTCIQGILIGEDEGFAFQKAFITFTKKAVCVENDTDEEYVKRTEQMSNYDSYKNVINRMFEP